MGENLVTIIFSLVVLAFAAYLLNQAGLGRNLTETTIFVVLGTILLIMTVTTLSHHSS